MMTEASVRPGQYWRSLRNPEWRVKVIGTTAGGVRFAVIGDHSRIAYDSLGWFLANFELLHESVDAAHEEALHINRLPDSSAEAVIADLRRQLAAAIDRAEVAEAAAERYKRQHDNQKAAYDNLLADWVTSPRLR